MITGAALILAGHVINAGINRLIARPGTPAAASELHRPSKIKSIAATQLSLGTSRLFALDGDERLWSCSVGPSLICHWTPVLQPRAR